MRLEPSEWEEPEIEKAKAFAIAIISQALLKTATDQHSHDEWPQLQISRAEKLRESLEHLDEFDKLKVGARVLHALVTSATAVLGDDLLGFLSVPSSATPGELQVAGVSFAWVMRAALAEQPANPSGANLLDVLYDGLLGLRLGEVAPIVTPARRSSRRANALELARVTWSACILREQLLRTKTAEEANRIFEENFLQPWDTTRKRMEPSKDRLGPREGTRIENFYLDRFAEASLTSVEGIALELQNLRRRRRAAELKS